MSVGAVSLPCFRSGWSFPSKEVGFSCDGLQVVWPDARTVSAKVVDMESLGNFSDE